MGEVTRTVLFVGEPAHLELMEIPANTGYWRFPAMPHPRSWLREFQTTSTVPLHHAEYAIHGMAYPHPLGRRSRTDWQSWTHGRDFGFYDIVYVGVRSVFPEWNLDDVERATQELCAVHRALHLTFIGPWLRSAAAR